MIKSKNCSHYFLLAVTPVMAFFLTGCPSGSPPPPKPEPCKVAVDCLIKNADGDACCYKGPPPGFEDGKKWVIRNDNPTRPIIAVVVAEVLNENRWIQEGKARLVRFEPKVRVQFDCARAERFDGAGIRYCTDHRRYSISEACFTDDSLCKTPTVPLDPGTGPFNCLKACATGDNSCIKFPYTGFGPAEQTALRDLRAGLQTASTPHLFPPNVIESTFFASAVSCNTRTSKLLRGMQLESLGGDCEVYNILPTSVPVFGTPYSFRQIWIKLPAILEGQVTRTSGQTQVDFAFNNVRSPWVTVELEGAPPNDKSRQDVITSLHILGAPTARGNIVLSGRDFMCASITDVPALGEGLRRNRRKR